MSRIYPECQTLTATGRVSLHEPSIQNVPRDFEVIATPQLLKKALGSTAAIQTSSNKSKNWNKSASLFMSQISQFLTEEPFQEENSVMSVSLRQAFVCSEGCLILAADYSQLELRILAHLSQDAKLMQILGPQNPGKYFMSRIFL